MTWFEIVAVAALLTILALRYTNLLFSLGAAIFWLVLWGYNLDHPPGGIAQGSALHEWMTFGFVIMAMAVMFMWVRNRGKPVTSVTGRISKNGEEGDIEIEHKGLMDLNEDEYRTRVRRALRSRRR